MPALSDRLDLRAPLLLAALVATGCGGGHGHHGHDRSDGPPVFQEVEPNDSPFAADFIGGVDAYSHLFVEGHVQAWDYDVYDHFEFVADEPLGIEFWLDGWNSQADVDLCLVDPDTGDVLACYDSPHGNESGYFTIDWPGKRFVLLVETWVVDTGYTLEIAAGPHPAHGPGGSPTPSAAPLEGATGISFPDGRPVPEKEEHLPGAPRRDAATSPERLALRERLGV